MNDKVKKKILNKKWENLEKLGLKRPKDSEENRRRIKEAHA